MEADKSGGKKFKKKVQNNTDEPVHEEAIAVVLSNINHEIQKVLPEGVQL